MLNLTGISLKNCSFVRFVSYPVSWSMHPVCKQLVQVKTLAPQSDLFDPGRVVGSHLQQNTGPNGFVIEIMYYIGYTVFVLISY